MNHSILADPAQAIVADGKGILAADESTPTCTKRFDDIGVDSTELSRNTYRDLLFTTSGIGRRRSTIWQSFPVWWIW